MKTKYNKEDLAHSLPDYISNKIDDKDLIKEIESEIINNSEFKNEFDELKTTLSFLSTTTWESPQESYFNNLPVRINERITKESSLESFWEKLSILWKILIPAIPVIILSIILFNNFTNKASDITQTETEKSKIESAENEKKNRVSDNKTELTQNEPVDKVQIEKPQANPIHKNRNILSFKNNSNSIQTMNKLNNAEQPKELTDIKNSITNLLADNIEPAESVNSDTDEDILYTGDKEDYNLEEEFLNLTPQQQQEILKDLNNKQI